MIFCPSELPDDVKAPDETEASQIGIDKPEVRTDKKSNATEKINTPKDAKKEPSKEVKKEPKKEPKPVANPPDVDKKSLKPKTAKNEKPPGEAKNKSSGERTKQKT